jgi:hypothetical protein
MKPTDVSLWDREIRWTGIWLFLVSKDCLFIYKQKEEQGYAMQTAPSHQDRRSGMDFGIDPGQPPREAE